MRRFLGWLLIVNALIALGVALIGWTMDWGASDYTLALLVACGVAFFATSATLGSSGPMSNVSGGAMTDAIGGAAVGGQLGGVVGMAVDDVAHSEWVGSSYAEQPGSTRGDFYARWRSRQGERPGPRPFFIMLATCLTTGAAAIVSWKFFE